MEAGKNRHEIRTFSDIVEAVNIDNLDIFLVDLKHLLMHTNLLKAANNNSLKGIDIDSFTFIDDGKNNLDLEVKSKDSDTSLSVKITDKKQ
jgi:hypothetical protein